MKRAVQLSLAVLLVIVLASTSTAFAFEGGTPPRPDTAPPGKGPQTDAPVIETNSPNVIAGRYIVVFKANTPDRAVQATINRSVKALKGQVHYVYAAALKGFAATLPAQALEAVKKNASVAYIAADQKVSLFHTQPNPPSWGLDRIDQRNLPLDASYTSNTHGAGVHAYVIDTGIRVTHSQFGGRATGDYTAINDGNGANDCNGHGTHVAGTIGGSTYGVANQVRLHAVRVLDCGGSGSYAGVIAGIDWVTANHVSPAVANMSLGGGAYQAVDDAVTNSIASGVTYAIAAGNSNDNACNYSPARTPNAITVGATESNDARASYSNYGTCLDLFAPGTGITSAWNTDDNATNTISGTSMATPHVAGVAALYLESNPGASPATVASAIINGATVGVVTNPGAGSPNRLLYSLLSSGGGGSLVNGGFENGVSPWVEYSSGGYGIVSSYFPRTGAYSAYMGGFDYAVEWIYQTVTIPAGGTLTYWWYMTTQEAPYYPYDYLYIELVNASDVVVATLAVHDNREVANVWHQDSINVGAWAGQTLRVRFRGTTDYSLPSSFFVDDVTL